MNALEKATSEDQVIISSRLKRKISKSNRGSAYRGVSKNGKKWQVSLFNIYKNLIGLTLRKFEETLHWLH